MEWDGMGGGCSISSDFFFRSYEERVGEIRIDFVLTFPQECRPQTFFRGPPDSPATAASTKGEKEIAGSLALTFWLSLQKLTLFCKLVSLSLSFLYCTTVDSAITSTTLGTKERTALKHLRNYIEQSILTGGGGGFTCTNRR